MTDEEIARLARLSERVLDGMTLVPVTLTTEDARAIRRVLAALDEAESLIRNLAVGIREWASEEDGIPDLLWPDCQAAVRYFHADPPPQPAEVSS